MIQISRHARPAGCLLALAVASLAWNAMAAGSSESPPAFEQDVQPVFEQFCYRCHGEKRKGGLDLRRFQNAEAVRAERELFGRLIKNVRTHEMPPSGKPQPTEAQRARLIAWIEQELFKVDCSKPDPGRVTIRRLNRTEYNNTIRDLVGVDFHPADDFPADDLGYGFDNIGDVLSVPPVLFERYWKAAGDILDAALQPDMPVAVATHSIPGAHLRANQSGGRYARDASILYSEGELGLTFEFPARGDYRLSVRAFAHQGGDEPARMALKMDGRVLRTFEVRAVERRPDTYAVTLKVPAGRHKLSIAFLNDFYDPGHPNPDRRDRNLIIEQLEVSGPLPSEPHEPPLPYRRIMICEPDPKDPEPGVRRILAQFARRAYRRPVSEEEVERLMNIFRLAREDGEQIREALKLTLRAVLVSPHFLFRGELQPDPDNPAAVYPVDEFALASRLSYFLWSSMPDDELFELAERGRLRAQLREQVQRMLHDPKSRALVENFGDQWLQIRGLAEMTPAQETFPEFDEALRAAMQKETELFFEHIMREDRSMLEFLDADYTFVNGRLARHYGIGGVQGPEFRKVKLPDRRRGGVLTHGSVLTLTSNPTRTSPVKRGKWVLENLLGAPPPPPPPNVPKLEEGAQTQLTGTLRQRMEQHRADPNCATCHERMDPIGFGLENFDGIGRWREREGSHPIDASGRLVTGEQFNGPAELRRVLVQNKHDQFIRCLAEKTLTYALGRGLEYYDKCAVDEISAKVAAQGYRFNALIMAVVESVPFQMRRGDDHAGDRERSGT